MIVRKNFIEVEKVLQWANYKNSEKMNAPILNFHFTT